jgi:hypothetical protein
MQLLRSMAAGPAALEIEHPPPPRPLDPYSSHPNLKRLSCYFLSKVPISTRDTVDFVWTVTSSSVSKYRRRIAALIRRKIIPCNANPNTSTELPLLSNSVLRTLFITHVPSFPIIKTMEKEPFLNTSYERCHFHSLSSY